MNMGFDILRVDERGSLWVEAVKEYSEAKRRVAELMKVRRCAYIIYSAETGEKFLIKESDGDT